MPRTLAPHCVVCGASAFLELLQDESGVYWPAHGGNHGFETTPVCLQKSCLKHLEKGDVLPHKVEDLLKSRVKKALSLAKKSGHLVVGQDEVEACFKSGRGVACIIIAENSGKSVQRLSQKWAEKLDVFRLLDKDTLGESVGFETCSVLGINPKAKAARTEISRYAQWHKTQRGNI